MIKLRDLEYFAAVAEHLHFGRAAEACFVSQPTLSGQLMRLEERLGVQLFERRHRDILLTQAGQALLPRAKQLLQQAADFEKTARTLSDPFKGELKLGSIPTLAPYLLPQVMPGLSKALPEMVFYLHEDKTELLLERVQSGELDAALLPVLEGMEEQFDCRDICDESLLMAVHQEHPYAVRGHVSLSMLKGQKVLSLEDGHCLRDQAMAYCFASGADEDQQYRATSLETLRAMISTHKNYITLIPKLAVSGVFTPAEGDHVSYLPFEAPAPVRKLVLLTRHSDSRAPLMDRMVTTLQSCLGSILP